MIFDLTQAQTKHTYTVPPGILNGNTLGKPFLLALSPLVLPLHGTYTQIFVPSPSSYFL